MSDRSPSSKIGRRVHAVESGKTRLYLIGLGIYGVLLFIGLNAALLLLPHSYVPPRERMMRLLVSFVICEIAGLFWSRAAWKRLKRLSR